MISSDFKFHNIIYRIYISHMVKLTFKSYKKPIKYFLIIFFLYKKMLTGYYQKPKRGFQKRLAKGTKIFLKRAI